ncbi:MAG: hypothetical protein BGO55_03635 [Sphingobacteriales bacterium 50-39]|nr:hypothetical protein [Sphingobacteriales bacterium]OJW55641.1 MAG: hypothetical protein BGO55_03635 [Sphingobacteriales bacterium 50-39]
MNSLRLLQLLLVFHLAGLTLMAGTTAVSFVSFKRLAKSMTGNIDEVSHDFKMVSGLSGLLILGGILLVSSGVGLLLLTHAYGQLWFQVKMGVVATLPLNGFLFGARQEQKIKQILSAPDGQIHRQLRQPIANLRTFYAIQLFLFLTVVILAVTRLG